MRLILVHAAADLPLRQIVALVAEAGGPDISPDAAAQEDDSRRGLPTRTRLLHGPRAGELVPERWAGYVVSLVDATVIPGSVNGDAHSPPARLSDSKYLQVRSTGIDEGETLCRFEFDPGELVVGDRGYSTSKAMFMGR